jgi:hydroxypyruvate isomerase
VMEGVLGDLERAHEFRENAPVALEVAASLSCRHLNALVGKEQPGQARDEQLKLDRDGP